MTASSATKNSDLRKGRARVTNDPMSARGHVQHTAQGRRVRDLFDAQMGRYGNPTDPLIVAEVLALAELKVMAESARLALLNGTDPDPDQLIRLENLIPPKEQGLSQGRASAKKLDPA